MKKRKWALTFTAILAATALAGCGNRAGSASSESAAASGGKHRAVNRQHPERRKIV